MVNFSPVHGILLVAFSTTSHAVQKCTDATGAVSYQAAPCPGQGAALKLDPVPASDPVEVRRANAVASGKVSVGMSADQVRRAWGTPGKVNKSVGSYGTHEQWVYDRGESRFQYVYVDNGVVTGVQTPGE